MSNPFPLVLQPASGSVSHQAVIALLHSKMIFNVNTREREREGEMMVMVMIHYYK